MKKLFTLLFLVGFGVSGYAQQELTLDSCRALALRNNKQLRISRIKKDVAYNVRKAMRTKYLPKVDAFGNYTHISKEVSALKKDQKDLLNNFGSNTANSLGKGAGQIITNLAQNGVITQQMAQQFGGLLAKVSSQIATYGDALGKTAINSFRTDTRNIWNGAVIMRQPIFMGGAIVAANKMADINEEIVDEDINLQTQNTIFEIDNAYWLVISLKEKQKLAYSYRDLVKKLSDDIHKMIKEGLATKADGLKVDVKVNEADMQVTQVEDGVILSKMLLCQLCGISMDSTIKLADEEKALSFSSEIQDIHQLDSTINLRPEISILKKTIDLSKQGTKIVRAAYLPQVALTAGITASNPNPFNGFNREFGCSWNVGVLVRVPIWNWFEGMYKVRASKATTAISKMELTDVQDKIKLQITQCRFKLREAYKRLNMANKNINSADENLRSATLGFKEGVIQSTDVMAAQTAWQLAYTQKIDAEIDVKLSQVNLAKALGTLQY